MQFGKLSAIPATFRISSGKSGKNMLSLQNYLLAPPFTFESSCWKASQQIHAILLFKPESSTHLFDFKKLSLTKLSCKQAPCQNIRFGPLSSSQTQVTAVLLLMSQSVRIVSFDCLVKRRRKRHDTELT